MNQLVRKTALSAVIALSFASTTRADDATTLDRLVVTANRSAVPAGEVLAATTVIERADIDASQAPDLMSLLARQAGVDIVRNGGAGQANTIFLRGTNSSHTLVLIDGIRVNAATQGIFDLAHLPLAQIERIEIVRGPRAALWGSDAIGGVIHIFTREVAAPYAAASAGSYDSSRIDAGVGNKHFALSAGIETVGGFSATNEKAGPYSFDPDDDGYQNRHLGLRLQGDIGSHALSFRGLLTDADVDFDAGPPFPGSEPATTAALNRELGLVLAGPLGTNWSHSLTLGRNTEVLDTPLYLSHFGSDRTSLDWVNTVALNPANTLNIGLNWSEESGYSYADPAFPDFDEDRRNRALFASWRGKFAAHTLELSARRDDNSQFDGATTGNAAWGWQASEAFRVRASWGQGFRAPNFNELYYPGFFGFYAGNPALQPERSTSAELGFDWLASDSQRLGLSVYRTRIRDLISFTGAPLFTAENISRASIDGAELEYHLGRGGFALDGNATWQDARNASTEAPLLRRPDRKLVLSATYTFGNGALLGLDGSATSSRPDVGDVVLPGYGRLDLRAAWPLGPGWTLEARVENLGDRDYQLLNGYNTPGRSGVINLRWNAN